MDYQEALAYIQLGFAIASLLGSLFIVISIIYLRRTVKAHGRFLLYLGISETLLAAMYIFAGLSQEYNFANGKSACKIEGFFVHFLNVMSWAWTSCIAFNMWAHVVRGSTNERMLKREKYCHMIAWSLALLSAGILYFKYIGEENQRNMPLNWCWVGKDSYSIFIFFYIPLLSAVVLNTALVSHTVHKILTVFNKHAEIQTSLLSTRSPEQVRRFTRGIIFYPIVLIICFSGAFLDRTYIWATGHSDSYVLGLLHVMMVLHGFLTAIVYASASSLTDAYRKKWESLKRTASGLEYNSTLFNDGSAIFTTTSI